MSETFEENRPKRAKRETSYKAKAFEKFKQLKSGTRNKYEVEELESVYETVDEKEYVKRVLNRQDDDWIVDDDGSGYVEDGRDIFDDDLDMASVTQATANKGKGTKRKKKHVSDNAGRGNLQYMLSNLPTKKKEETNITDDDILTEILGEVDETPSCSEKSSKSQSSSVLSQKQAARDYMSSFSIKKPKLTPKKQLHTSLNKSSTKIETIKSINETSETKTNINQIEKSPEGSSVVLKTKENDTEDTTIKEALKNCSDYFTCTNNSSGTASIEESKFQDDFDDCFDMTQIEDLASQNMSEDQTKEDWTQIMKGIDEEFSSNWQEETEENFSDFQNDWEEESVPVTTDNDLKVFRFFWWDAYEGQGSHRGTVYLFGKTYCEKSKTYASCCVAVNNIHRQVFVLPNSHAKLPDKDGNIVEQPVTQGLVYREFNEVVIKPLKIKLFKSRFVQKKYAFSPRVPESSEYMEVKYSASDPPIETSNTFFHAETFSRIFGTNASFLEIFLLERKIKGPCWLDIIEPVSVGNPVSWCKYEIECSKTTNVCIVKSEKPLPPPPLVVASINFRYYFNRKTFNNEIVMLSCVAHKQYQVDKQAPNPPFQEHFCIFSNPGQYPLPLDIHVALKEYRGTKVQKMDSEKALLNYFIMQFSRIDPDLVVGHDLQGYQLNILSNRLSKYDIKTFSRIGRLKRTDRKKLERELFVGRLVCDIKISAKELIKSRSYDLDSLCQSVLKTKEKQRIDFEPEEIPKLYQNSQDILKLISFTMQDTSFILRIMYSLNVLPLALQITNIAGNVMSKTLMGGRSERNEYLLLHAFSEKGYIVPDKHYAKKDNGADRNKSSRKKPTYSGGLVLDPKIGFYDHLILLMDFNSLYPSIIQEYNICFTTLPVNMDFDDDDVDIPMECEENTEKAKESEEDLKLVLPNSNSAPGILPTEIRKLVESRRQVKSLMKSPDLSDDLRMQYHIRQMALKLTANSMYGCLGFSNSRFYAKNLAALVTMKGREILINTKELVQKMCLEVVYGDTDSIMINTNILDYDQVFKIGHKIKQEVNRFYKNIELDIDGVFKYLLLLKKKKYAAVTLSKTKEGVVKEHKEYKGLDIVRRDWSQLACEAGKYILECILSDQSADDRIDNIRSYLTKIKEDLNEGKVPVQLLVITKQLTKDIAKYTDKNSQPHVLVAQRYNRECGGHFRAGDTVPYIICDDGSTKSATQRAYHTDELKNSETLKIDTNYYLSQQIHPVVSRICEPVEGIDGFQIAEWLGIDGTSFKRSKPQNAQPGEVISKPELKFQNVDKFVFKCYSCRTENQIGSALVHGEPFLEKCANADCTLRPLDYLSNIQNQLTLSLRSYIKRYYNMELICEDPACTNVSKRLPLRFLGKYPACNVCSGGSMFRRFGERQLYMQLLFFLHLFDLGKLNKKPILKEEMEHGFLILKDTVEKFLQASGFSLVNLAELFAFLFGKKRAEELDTVYLIKAMQQEGEVELPE